MSRSYKICYSTKAKNDLYEIYDYISQRLCALQNAKNTIAKIVKEVRSLSFMPARYALLDREPWKSLGLRKTKAGNFNIFYLIKERETTVFVTRVLFGGRDNQNIELAA